MDVGSAHVLLPPLFYLSLIDCSGIPQTVGLSNSLFGVEIEQEFFELAQRLFCSASVHHLQDMKLADA